MPDDDPADDIEKDIRFLKDSIRLLGDNVESTLLTRGWAVADLNVDDEEPLEWFWPPTAPVGYGGLPEYVDDVMRRRPGMFISRKTPWVAPTRLTKVGDRWRLDYGQAIAQKPDKPRYYSAETELIADLEQIEWWPMRVEEAREIRAYRLLETTTAAAHDQHHQATFPTAPYARWQDDLQAHLLYEQSGDRAEQPDTPRTDGNLEARLRLIDADIWASAVRTARAGGEGWGANGPR